MAGISYKNMFKLEQLYKKSKMCVCLYGEPFFFIKIYQYKNCTQCDNYDVGGIMIIFSLTLDRSIRVMYKSVENLSGVT